MGKIKRTAILTGVFSLLFLSMFSMTARAEGNGFSDMDYTIDAYDVNITVQEDNSMNITETITAYFNVPKHGICRSIPLRNKIERLDGTASYNNAEISQVSISDPYMESTENANRIFKIGDADTLLEGEKQYSIKYTYSLGKDTGKGYDELYYNIIGDDWDTYISHVTFTITMPEAFDASKLGFSSGKKGTVDSSHIEYEVGDNVITGFYDGILSPKEALTVRLELPEGYFYLAKERPINPVWMILLFAVPLLLVGVVTFLWYQYGRSDRIVETVEFYPPDGMNSLDVAFWYRGRVRDKDVTSLLIYLANKGYYKITDTLDKVGPFKRAGFKITRQKYYDGFHQSERLFCRGLFSVRRKNAFCENQECDQDVVTDRDLYDEFYKTTNQILKIQNSKENRKMIFEAGQTAIKAACILVMAVIFLLMFAKPIQYLGALGIVAGFMIGGCLIKIIWLLMTAFSLKNGKKVKKLIGKVTAIVFYSVILCFSVYAILPALLYEPQYIPAYVFDLLCVALAEVLYHKPKKRTPDAACILGKIEGFRNFLETAEKPVLEEMVTENPAYFYDILPYTYVLEVSDKWIKKFEPIFMDAPSWYGGDNFRSGTELGQFMNQMMSAASSSMSSSSGGSSGGGSSGGGSGGGGGSSW